MHHQDPISRRECDPKAEAPTVLHRNPPSFYFLQLQSNDGKDCMCSWRRSYKSLCCFEAISLQASVPQVASRSTLEEIPSFLEAGGKTRKPNTVILLLLVARLSSGACREVVVVSNAYNVGYTVLCCTCLSSQELFRKRVSSWPKSFKIQILEF